MYLSCLFSMSFTLWYQSYCVFLPVSCMHCHFHLALTLVELLSTLCPLQRISHIVWICSPSPHLILTSSHTLSYPTLSRMTNSAMPQDMSPSKLVSGPQKQILTE